MYAYIKKMKYAKFLSRFLLLLDLKIHLKTSKNKIVNMFFLKSVCKF